MPTAASTRLGLIGPAATDPVAEADDRLRALITQLEARAEELPTVGSYTPLRSTGTPTYPTTPTSPRDGQRYLLRIGASAAGLFQMPNPAAWEFRYSTAAGRWESVGGSPASNQGTDTTAQGQLTAAGTWYGSGSSGQVARFVVPFAGRYVIEWGSPSVGFSASGGGTAQIDMGLTTGYLAGTAPASGFIDSILAFGSGSLSGLQAMAAMQVMNLSQGADLGVLFRCSAATWGFFSRPYLKITPLYLT